MKHGLTRTGISKFSGFIAVRKIILWKIQKIIIIIIIICLFYNQYAIFYHYGFEFSLYPTGVNE